MDGNILSLTACGISARSSVSLLCSSSVIASIVAILPMVCVPQCSVTPRSHNLSSSLP